LLALPNTLLECRSLKGDKQIVVADDARADDHAERCRYWLFVSMLCLYRRVVKSHCRWMALPLPAKSREVDAVVVISGLHEVAVGG